MIYRGEKALCGPRVLLSGQVIRLGANCIQLSSKAHLIMQLIIES